MQIEAFLESTARQRPDNVALVVGQSRWTFAELEAAANRMARALGAAGLRRGDRVAIYLENGFEAVVSIFATLKAGAVFMMVNSTTKADKLRFMMDNSRAAMLIAPAWKLPALDDALAHMPHLRSVVVCGAPPESTMRGKPRLEFGKMMAERGGSDCPPAKQAIDIDPAALMYTSGSTGNPKGVTLTHLNVISAATSIAAYLENKPDDAILNVLPLSFGYGLCQLLTAAKTGATLVLERSFAYPHAVLQKAVDERVTAFPLVPTISAILCQMDLANYDLGSLRYITNAAAALPTEHIRQLRRLLPHVRIYSMYGLTECLRVSYLPPEEIDQRPNSVGRGMPNEEVYIVDDQGNRVEPGMVGELVVRGSHVMKGYWELPEETERKLRPGPLPGERVLYTGDLFRMDEEGYLYFVSRKDDMIKSRGEKVSPKEVENALYQHPEIVEAVVVGVPDAILGEAIKAVVTLKSGSRLTDREILRHCAGRLEDFMVPKFVEIRSSLPKTPNGKIDKRSLLAPPCPDGSEHEVPAFQAPAMPLTAITPGVSP